MDNRTTTGTAADAEGTAPPEHRHLRRGGTRRLAALAVAGASLLVVIGIAAPASAAMSQVRGDAYYDTDGSVCVEPPEGFEIFVSIDPLVLDGDLEGCLWTEAGASRSTPSGVFLEEGREVFEGTYLGGDPGTFATTYRFESKWDVEGNEIHGRCQHPIVAGSGTGGFEGVSGRLFFKDAPPEYFYRGHLSFD
jgi:hypothetical protein